MRWLRSAMSFAVRRAAGDCLPDPAVRDVTRNPARHLDLHLHPVAHGLPLARHRGPGAESIACGDRGLERPERLRSADHLAVLALRGRRAPRQLRILLQAESERDGTIPGAVGTQLVPVRNGPDTFAPDRRSARDLQAVRRNSFGDQAITSVAFTAYAMPDFLLYLIAIQIFALTFSIFGFEASQSTSLITVVGDWHDMALPIICLTLLILAGYSRYMRSSAMDILAQDYIKTARAKGLPERLVLLRHLVRNAFLPMITLIGLSIPALLAGNLIAESVFNYDGLGLLFYSSLQNEDYPVLLAYTLVGAVLTVLGNLLADVALTIADPRVRLS